MMKTVDIKKIGNKLASFAAYAKSGIQSAEITNAKFSAMIEMLDAMGISYSFEYKDNWISTVIVEGQRFDIKS